MELPQFPPKLVYHLPIQLLHSTSTIGDDTSYRLYVHWRYNPRKHFHWVWQSLIHFYYHLPWFFCINTTERVCPRPSLNAEIDCLYRIEIFFCWFTLSIMSSMKTLSLSNTSQQKSSLQKMILTIRNDIVCVGDQHHLEHLLAVVRWLVATYSYYIQKICCCLKTRLGCIR